MMATFLPLLFSRQGVLPDPTFSEPIPLCRQSAPDATWAIPVVSIRFIPTVDGRNVDQSTADFNGTVLELQNRIDRLEANAKSMIEEGSRYHGYSRPEAHPSLGVRFLATFTFYVPMPRGRPDGQGHFFPDYDSILKKIDAKKWVEGQGVKEFWVWQYHHGTIVPVESAMSNPQGLSISNGSTTLPKCSKTYTMYGLNFNRGQSMVVHDRCHQLEALFGWADRRATQVNQVWSRFTGYAGGSFRPGRCGDCHHPPNATKDYDYHNQNPVESDIMDWRPEGGTQTPVSCRTWEQISYPYPYPASRNRRLFEGDDNWYVFWMQSIPGLDPIPTIGPGLTNWWRFMGDFDGALAEGTKLVPPKRSP